MSSEGGASGPDHDRGLGWRFVLGGLLVLMDTGDLVWRLRRGNGFRPAAEVSSTEALELKAKKELMVVQIGEHDPSASRVSDLVRDGNRYSYIHTVVPPACSIDAQGFDELESGLDPNRLIVRGRSSWGCR